MPSLMIAAFTGQYHTEISTALAPKWLQEPAFQFVLGQTALILKPWSWPSTSYLPKNTPKVWSGHQQPYYDRAVVA